MRHWALMALGCAVVCLASADSDAADRVALVIGNSKYAGELALQNPSNDADALDGALKELGFKVFKKQDLDHAQMGDALVEFSRALPKGSLGLFYYAGHGLQVKGQNFLVPVGTRIREEFEVKRQCVEVGEVLDAMSASESNLKVVILDCCRDNPLERSWKRRGGMHGLAAISEIPDGTLIAYSTSPGKTAADGRGKNSPYAEHLVATLRSRPAGGLELLDVFREASQRVKKATHQEQVPWLNMEASLEKYYLRSGGDEKSTSAISGGSVASPSETRPSPKSTDSEPKVVRLRTAFLINTDPKATIEIRAGNTRKSLKANASGNAEIPSSHTLEYWSGNDWQSVKLADAKEEIRFSTKESDGKRLWKHDSKKTGSATSVFVRDADAESKLDFNDPSVTTTVPPKDPPKVPPQGSRIILTSLVCHTPEDDAADGDEAVLTIIVDGRVHRTYSRQMGSGSPPWTLNEVITFQKYVSVNLVDDDSGDLIGDDDNLGTVQIAPNQLNGRGSFTGHGANYTLSWTAAK